MRAPRFGSQFLAALFASALLASASHASPWDIAEADATSGAGRSNQIALDPGGLPHVAYWHVLAGVRHAWFNGAYWQNEPVESPVGGEPGIDGGVAEPASTQLLIAVDVAAAVFGDTPMLAYAKANYLGHSPVYGPIRFGVRGTGGWTVESVGSLTGLAPELAVGPGGHVHIVCISDGQVVHAERAGTGWAIDTVASGIWSTLSLRVDANDVPHVAYASGWTLTYARRTPLGWTSEPVTDAGAGASLVLDEQGEPRLAYSAGTAAPFTLTYAVRGQVGWSSVPVAPIGTQYIGSSMALDEYGRPRIAYVTGAEYGTKLRLAFSNGGPWTTETVDTTTSSVQSPSLAIGDADRAWISYNRATGDVLLAATELPVAGVEPGSGAARFAVGIAGVNPVRAGAVLSLFLDSPVAQAVSLDLFDAAGRRIAARSVPHAVAGRQALAWPVRARTPGLYLIRARGANGERAVARVVVVE